MSRIYTHLLSTFGQETAYRVRRSEMPIAATRVLCKVEGAGGKGHEPDAPAYHFRTPSPDGQQAHFRALLPINLLGGRNRRNPADSKLCEYKGIHERRCRSYLGLKDKSIEGHLSCNAQLVLHWLLPVSLGFPPAGIRLGNKPLLAGPWAPGRRPSQAGVWRKARPSGLRATCFIARPIHASAKRLTRHSNADARRRPGSNPVRRFLRLRTK